MPLDYTNIAAITEKKQTLLKRAQCFLPMFYGENADENDLTEIDVLRAYLFLSLHKNKIAQKSNVLLIKLLNASYGDVKNFHAEALSSMTEEDFNHLFQNNPEVREYLIIFKDVFNVIDNGLREATEDAIRHQYDALKKGMLLYELQQWLKTAEDTNKRRLVEQALISHLKGLQSSVLDVSLLAPLWIYSDDATDDIFSFFKPEVMHLSQQNHFSPLTLEFDEPEQPIDYDKWSMLAYCYDHYYDVFGTEKELSELEKTQHAGRIAAFGLIIQWFRLPDQLEQRLEKIAALNKPNFLTYVLDTFCDPDELACYRTQIQKMQDASALLNDVLAPRLLNRQRKDQEMRISTVTSSSCNSQKTSPLSRNTSDDSDGYGNNTDTLSDDTKNNQKNDSLTLEKNVMDRTPLWNFPLFNRRKNNVPVNNSNNASAKKNSPTSTLKKTQNVSMLIRNL